MSNPNNNRFDRSSEDDSDTTSASSEKPFSTPALEMLLKRDKHVEQEVRTKEKEKKEDDDEESAESAPEVPKRKRVGQALRGLLKRRRNQLGPVPGTAETPKTEQVEPAENTRAEGIPAGESEPELTHGTELKFDHEEPKYEEPKTAEKSDSIFDQLRSAAETPVGAEKPMERDQPAVPEQPVELEPQADEPPTPPEPPRYSGRGSEIPQLPPPNTGPSFGNLPPTSPDRAPRTTIIEKNSSGAGHLLTLFAANYLSKRRDRKLKRQDLKLEKAQKVMRDESDQDRRRLREVDRRQRSESRDQQQQIRSVENSLNEQALYTEKPDINPATEIRFNKAANVVASPVKVSEVLAAREFGANQPPETAEEAERVEKEVSRSKPSPEQDLREFYAEEARRHAKETEDEHRELLRRQSGENESAEDVRESIFERRHEIKDEPGSNSRAVVPVGNSSGDSGNERIIHDEPEAKSYLQEQVTKARDGAQQAVNSVRTDDDMREAVRNGFLIGVGTVAVGIIAYLLT